MNYIAREVITDDNVQKTAGIKARDDVETIAAQADFKVIDIDLPDEQERSKTKFLKKLWFHKHIQNKWTQGLSGLKGNDCIIIQFPIIHHTLLFKAVIRSLHKRGIKVILIIHDLEILRVARRKNTSGIKRIRLNLEERSILLEADHVIAHNAIMANTLEDIGVPADKIVDLQLFDYIIKNEENRAVLIEHGPVIIAGNLRRHKAEYIYNLSGKQTYNLYGVGYDGEQNSFIHYYGSFMPDDLPGHLTGSFGLVWDGNRTDTCAGTYGEYLKINNPHKTSLYLASGLPVIIWKDAALAQYVEDNKCGILVSSLEEIPEKINSLTKQDYLEIAENADNISKLLRNGFYTKRALKACGIKTKN